VRRTLTVGVVAILLLTGCASLGDRVAEHIDSGIAATGSERIAVQQLRDGLALPPFVGTVLSDGLAELQDAATQVEALEPATTAERRVRTAALDALRTAIDATLQAREAVAADSGLGAAEAALDDAHHALEELARAAP
jgi:major membrane immunogen (membrane-anchored lipoprotein)